jgi:predicted TIM-barrel fold metal-dependent hydrolase
MQDALARRQARARYTPSKFNRTSTMPALAQPRVPAPPGACDTHMHIFTPGHAMLPGTNIPAQDGSLARYRAMQRRLGLTRTVIVQPTAYGFDNTVTLKRHGRTR